MQNIALLLLASTACAIDLNSAANNDNLGTLYNGPIQNACGNPWKVDYCANGYFGQGPEAHNKAVVGIFRDPCQGELGKGDGVYYVNADGLTEEFIAGAFKAANWPSYENCVLTGNFITVA